MRPLRWLIVPHYLYFLSLPSLALVATAMLGEQRGVGSVCLFGLVPVAVFIALMAYCYTVPQDLVEALDYIFAVPLRVALSCWFLHATVWYFITQITAVEIGAFVCALGYIEVRERPLTVEGVSTALLAGFVFVLLMLNAMPFMVLAWRASGGVSPLWLVFFGAAFLTALRQHARRLAAAAHDYKEALARSAADATDQQINERSFFARWLGIAQLAPVNRLVTLEYALPTTLIFLLLYLLTPMFSGFLLAPVQH